MKGLWIMFLMVAFVATLSAQTTAEEYAREAGEKYREKDYHGAIEILKKAQALDTMDYSYSRGISICYIALGDNESADNTMDSLTVKHPNKWQAYTEGAYYYTANKQFYKSLDLMESAVKKFTRVADTTRMQLYTMLGQTKFDLQDFEGAKKSYMSGYKLGPDDRSNWYNLAKTYKELKDLDSATYFYKKIEQVAPDDLLLYINWGFMYNKLGKYDDAIILYEKAIKQIAKYKDVPGKYSNMNIGLLHSNYGYALLKTGNYKKALIEFEDSIYYYPTNSYIYRNRALLYIEQKKFDEACIDLQYAASLGFGVQYGGEVEMLLGKHCK